MNRRGEEVLPRQQGAIKSDKEEGRDEVLTGMEEEMIHPLVLPDV
jgi:hypothetical protein